MSFTFSVLSPETEETICPTCGDNAPALIPSPYKETDVTFSEDVTLFERAVASNGFVSKGYTTNYTTMICRDPRCRSLILQLHEGSNLLDYDTMLALVELK